MTEAEWKTLTVNNKVYEDPRPDMPEDAFLWLQLFADADNSNPKLYKVLLTVRSPGSRIIRGKTSYLIRPEIDPEGVHGWLSQEQYSEYTGKWLKPYRYQVAGLLKGLQKLFW